jgi:RHS repeat-associated protein
VNNSFRGLVASTLLVVACGSDSNQQGTSGPSEGIPNARGNSPHRGIQGGAGGAVSGFREGANGGMRSIPPTSSAAGGVVGESLGAGGEADESEVLELPPGWNPGDDLSPIAWYVASPTDYQVVSGGAATWLDRRGNDNNLTQATSWAQPQLVTAEWNGEPTVRFDGGDLLNASWSGPPMGTNAGFTVLAVLRSEEPQNAGVAAWWSEWGDGVWANLRSTSGLTLLDYHRLDDGTFTQMYAGNQDLGTEGGHVVAWRFSPSTQTVTLTVDGANVVSSPQPPVGNISAMPLIVGAMSPLPTGFFKGDISELVIVGDVISDDQVQNFTEYAQDTWNLPTSAGSGPCIKADGQPSPDTIRCDDGNPETFGDHCSAGTCLGVVPGPGSPNELDPVAWYHAGAPEVVSTFGGVSTWFDRSSQHRDLLNGYSGRPPLVADGWDGSPCEAPPCNKPTVRFGGFHALKRNGWTGSPGGSESAFTVLAVLKASSSSGGGVATWWHPANYSWITTQLKPSGGATVLDLFRHDDTATVREFVGDIGLGLDQHVVAWRYSNGVAKLTIDGVTRTQAQSAIGNFVTDWFLMGVASGYPTGIFNGDISELAIIPRSISDTAVARFNDYAQAEWGGLTLCAPNCVGKPNGAPNDCGGFCDSACDLNAPFDAPVAAFTGSMDADGLTFSADGLTAYISAIGTGGRDIFVAKRTVPNGTFGPPTAVFSTNEVERAPSLSADGLTLSFTKSSGVWFDIARAVRTSTAVEFANPQVIGNPVSTSQQDEDPFWLGNDTLYFVSEFPGGAHRDIKVTTLSGSPPTFSTPALVQNVNSTAEEYRPVLSPDGLTLYFGSKRSGIGNDSSGDIWMARRTSPTEAFPQSPGPVNLWGLNSTGIEFPVTVSPDGCTLYFASNEETGLGASENFRLYQATRGTSTPAQVTLRLNILGQGSVTTAPFNCGPGNTGTCSASAPPDTTMLLWASGPATWTGSCTGNGTPPQSDGIVAFSENAVCTVKFAGGSLVGPGGLCSLSMDCQAGLACNNGTCGCGPGAVCSATCPCGPGGPCTSQNQCQAGLECTNGTCGCAAGAACSEACPCGSGGICTSNNQCQQGFQCTNGTCSCSPGTCSSTCPCGNGEGACQQDSDCAGELKCLIGYGPHFGKPRGTNVCGEPPCPMHKLEMGCGFPAARCGTSCENGVSCETDGDCPAGEVCGIGMGSAYGLSFANVCVPPVCVSDPVAGGCGTFGSLCGQCPCTRTCDTKACGDDPEDGCGGRCREFCDDREPGCTADADCPAGSACFIEGGPRIGLPEGTNVCLPVRCLDPNPARSNCGGVNSECGTCSQPPFDDICGGLQCSADPAVAAQCGLAGCASGTTCIGGECAQDFSVHDIDLATTRPVTRERFNVPPAPLPEPPLPTETVPGAVAGTFAVNARGRATYAVPITVPPGRDGMQPDLSIDFVDGASNGLVGMGWSIGGLSSISRCTKVAALNPQPNFHNAWAVPVQFTNDDQLCLDGNPLIHVNPDEAANLSPGAEYRTEIDTFSRVKIQAVENHLHFKVYKKDGRILTYGSEGNSGGGWNAELHRDKTAGLVRAWALSRIEDRVGNYISFRYGKFVDQSHADDGGEDQTVEFWPTEVSYGGLKSDLGTVSPSRAVRFSYRDDRNDYMDGYTRGGSRITRTKLLSRIETFVGSKSVRSYELDYEDAPTGVPQLDPPVAFGVKRVRSISECSNKNDVRECKRPTVFTYADQRGFEDVDPSDGEADVVFSDADVVNAAIQPLDWNGDGLTDLLAPGKLLIATGVRDDPYRQVDTGVYCPEAFDFNLDGRDDALDTCWGDIYRSTGIESQPFLIDHSADGGGQESRLYLLDINGDGVKDLFDCAGGASVELGVPGEGFAGLSLLPIGEWEGCLNQSSSEERHSQVLVADIDGDGADDVLVSNVVGSGAEWAKLAAHPDGSTSWVRLENLDTHLHLAAFHGGVRFIDVNGDGLKDIYAIFDNLSGVGEQFEGTPYIYVNTGGTFDIVINAHQGLSEDAGATLFGANTSIAIDYTGDGREDLLRIGSGWQLDIGSLTDPSERVLAGLPWLIPGIGHLVPQLNVGFAGVSASFSGNRSSRAYSPASTLADVDGDGSLDLVGLTASNAITADRVAVIYGRMGREHLLSRVVDGMGKRVDVTYGSTQGFSDGVHRVHVPATNLEGCVEAEFGYSACARQPGPLVSRYTLSYDRGSSAGGAVDRTFVMRYEGGREGLLGRGWLGFDRRIIEERVQGEEDTQLVQRTEIYEDNRTFDQQLLYYPFAGLEERRITSTPVAGSTLATDESRGVTRRDNVWIVKMSSAGRPFPFLDNSTQSTSELVGATPHRVSSTLSLNDGDEFGNVTYSDVRLHGPNGELVSQAATASAFDIRDGEEWLIGLPDTATVTNFVPGGGSPESVSRSVDYTFDERGLLSRVVREPNTDGNCGGDEAGVCQQTDYERDPADMFQSVRSIEVSGRWTDSGGSEVVGTRKTSFEYAGGRFFLERVHAHRSASMDCSEDNAHTTDCLSADLRFHPFDGTLLTRVDPTGIVQRTSYDAFGRIRSNATAADTIITTYSDAFPDEDAVIDVFPKLNITTTSVNTGARSTQLIDALGRTVQTLTVGIGGEVVQQESEYLFGGLVSRASRPHRYDDDSQGLVTNTYDARFRLFQVVLPDDGPEHRRRIEYQYATAGLYEGGALEPSEAFVTAVVDPRLNTNLKVADARGLSVRAVDADDKTTRYAYGAFGTLRRITETIDNQPDHLTFITSDDLGRMLTHQDDDSGTTTYRYTGFDQVAYQTDNLLRTTSLTYDNLGRLERIDSPDGPTDFAYDGAGTTSLGRLSQTQTTTSDGNGLIVELYTYEEADNDPLKTRGFLDHIDRVIGDSAFNTTFRYNQKSQLDHVIYPATPAPTTSDPDRTIPFQVFYGYDAYGNMTCVSDDELPSPLGSPSDCGSGRFWRLDEAFQGYRVQEESFGNGVTTTYGYENPTGRLSSMVTRDGGTIHASVTYPEYDANGNLHKRNSTFRSPTGGATTTTTEETFSNDDLNRLTSIARNDEQTESIVYNGQGNITSKSGVGRYDYDENAGELRAPHAVRRITDLNDNTLASFAYDRVGNMTKRSGAGVEGGTQTFTYTAFNLPRTTTIGEPGTGAKNLHYEYDAAHRRILLSVDANNDPDDFAPGDENRLYIGSGYERIVSNEGTAGTFTRHLYKVFAAGRQVAQLERVEQNGIVVGDDGDDEEEEEEEVGERRYIHGDHLGSSQVITNEEGELVHVQRFDPFGAPIDPDTDPTSTSTDAATKNIRRGFTGHETDVETGLVNMGGRIYDPRIGRFMQADPILQPGWSQTLNRYSYVANNPLNGVDPTGFLEDEDDLDPEDDPALKSIYVGDGDYMFVAQTPKATVFSGSTQITGSPPETPSFQKYDNLPPATNASGSTLAKEPGPVDTGPSPPPDPPKPPAKIELPKIPETEGTSLDLTGWKDADHLSLVEIQAQTEASKTQPVASEPRGSEASQGEAAQAIAAMAPGGRAGGSLWTGAGVFHWKSVGTELFKLGPVKAGVEGIGLVGYELGTGPYASGILAGGGSIGGELGPHLSFHYGPDVTVDSSGFHAGTIAIGGPGYTIPLLGGWAGGPAAGLFHTDQGQWGLYWGGEVGKGHGEAGSGWGISFPDVASAWIESHGGNLMP